MDPGRTIQRHVLKRRPQRRLQRWRLKPLVGSLATIAGIFGLMVLIPSMALKIAGLDRPSIPLVGPGLQIYDRYDRKLCTIFGDRDQQLVKLDAVSPHVPKAFFAAEDHDFYYHGGINLVAITRAILVDISRGHPVQGGSTISQQLIKNLYFEGKRRTLSDKITEAFMAMDIEKRYSKEQILEAYLNCVYFGHGVYGIQRASEQYFGKPASKLDLAESAFLAGLVTAPSDLSRPGSRKAAVRRQQLILNSMKDLNYVSDKEIAAAKKEHLAFRTVLNPAQKYRQYTSEVVQLCQKELNCDPDELFEKGYRVYTNMDARAQEVAARTISSGIRNAPKGINQGALVSINVEDGGIIALVGGASKNAEWNNAMAPHTAGSAFKPFVYLAALNKGVLSPDMLIDDEPIEIKQPGAPVYRPKNYDGTFMGPITIRKAIALSRNTCAVRVAQEVGPGEIVRCAREAGINGKLDENLSLALGSSAVSPLEMANAYATLARGGEFVEAQLVRKITDADGKTIKEFKQQSKQAFDEEPVAELVDALQDVVEKGTGTRARLFDRPVAGKTGTSDAGKDIWFVGFTPDTVTAVWGGNDQNKPVPGHVTGGGVMAGIWHNYMAAYYQQHAVPVGEFPQPEHPLLEDGEPLEVWPSGAPIIEDFINGWINPAPQTPAVREYNWAPRRYTQPESDFDEDKYEEMREKRADEAREKQIAKRHPKKRGLFRKLWDWVTD